MSVAVAAPFTYRHAVEFCVLPAELAGLYDELRRTVAGLDVRVVVERRAEKGADRRSPEPGGAAPDGVERRTGDRRAPAGEARTLADLGVRLPWALRRHAARIACVTRFVPVHRADAEAAAFSLLLEASSGDATARHELRLRYHEEIHGYVRAAAGVPRRKAAVTVDAVFEELFSQPAPPPFRAALSDAYARVLTA